MKALLKACISSFVRKITVLKIPLFVVIPVLIVHFFIDDVFGPIGWILTISIGIIWIGKNLVTEIIFPVTGVLAISIFYAKKWSVPRKEVEIAVVEYNLLDEKYDSFTAEEFKTWLSIKKIARKVAEKAVVVLREMNPGLTDEELSTRFTRFS